MSGPLILPSFLSLRDYSIIITSRSMEVTKLGNAPSSKEHVDPNNLQIILEGFIYSTSVRELAHVPELELFQLTMLPFKHNKI